MNSNIKISVFGLGYVGLPLALALSNHFSVIGYDHNRNKVSSLKNFCDENKEFSKIELKKYKKIKYSTSLNEISESNTYIVALPTPIDKKKKPNQGSFLLQAFQFENIQKISYSFPSL